MKNRLIEIGLLILLISSCKNEITAKFEILNKTNHTIDSLRIVPNGYKSDFFITILPNETKEYITDMTNISKADGDYRLDLKFDTSAFTTKRFGYYTNGFPVEKLTKISIYKDTIMFDFELNNY